MGPIEHCPVKKSIFPSGVVFANKRYVGDRAAVVRCDIDWAGFLFVSLMTRAEVVLRSRSISACIVETNSESTDSELSTIDHNIVSWYFSGIKVSYLIVAILVQWKWKVWIGCGLDPYSE